MVCLYSLVHGRRETLRLTVMVASSRQYLKAREYKERLWTPFDVAGTIRGSHEWYWGLRAEKGLKWLKPEHPYTAISPNSEVHANHNEAHNSAVLRLCSAYRRRTNTYALRVDG